MARKQPYSLSYVPAVHKHLEFIEGKHHAAIRAKVEEQLLFEPETETKNRKPLRQPAPFEATWELRFGPGNRFRVFFGVDNEQREVQILAVGVKERNRLNVGGEEVEP